MASQWYVVIANNVHGPFTFEQLKQLAASGRLNPSALVRQGESGKWYPAAKVEGLFNVAVGPASKPMPRPYDAEKPNEHGGAGEWNPDESGWRTAGIGLTIVAIAMCVMAGGIGLRFIAELTNECGLFVQ